MQGSHCGEAVPVDSAALASHRASGELPNPEGLGFPQVQQVAWKLQVFDCLE
ncbi:hypothetical protein KBT16_18215 [Nostoc sp. CCCryo 231-06]|nr:hypothetical protein [Nostoc sp. CCCryo 231-06]